VTERPPTQYTSHAESANVFPTLTELSKWTCGHLPYSVTEASHKEDRKLRPVTGNRPQLTIKQISLVLFFRTSGQLQADFRAQIRPHGGYKLRYFGLEAPPCVN
jgi:hypothetical protein